MNFFCGYIIPSACLGCIGGNLIFNGFIFAGVVTVVFGCLWGFVAAGIKGEFD